MFSSIRKKSSFYNKSIMDYSLKSTNDYIKRIIEKNDDKKFDDKKNEIIINILDESSSDNFKTINYIPICMFLSISSFLCIILLKN
jgi:hypothetical protein